MVSAERKAIGQYVQSRFHILERLLRLVEEAVDDAAGKSTIFLVLVIHLDDLLKRQRVDGVSAVWQMGSFIGLSESLVSQRTSASAPQRWVGEIHDANVHGLRQCHVSEHLPSCTGISRVCSVNRGTSSVCASVVEWRMALLFRFGWRIKSDRSLALTLQRGYTGCRC